MEGDRGRFSGDRGRFSVSFFKGQRDGSPVLALGPLTQHKKISLSSDRLYGIRRRPTLPGRYQPSTIGTEGLNFCVRYGNRWDPFVITTGNGNDFHTDRDPAVTRIRYALSDRSSLSSSDRRSYCTTLSSIRQEGDTHQDLRPDNCTTFRLLIQTDLFFCSQLISFCDLALNQALDLLVSSSSTHYCASTDDLSTW